MNVYDGAELNEIGARYWLAMDGWSVEEAAYLLHGLDPRYQGGVGMVGGRRLIIQPFVPDDDMTAMLIRAFDMGTLPSPAPPSEVIAWANSKKLKLPVQFLGDAKQWAAPVLSPEPPATPNSAPAIAAPGPVVADGVATNKAEPVDKGWVMKKAALIDKNAQRWPTAKRDFQDASENGLSSAAKAPGHGEWFENAALKWAEQRGKLTSEKQQTPTNSVFNLPGKKHTMKD